MQMTQCQCWRCEKESLIPRFSSGYRGPVRFCSNECRHAYRREQDREHKRAQRALAAPRRIKQLRKGKCESCGAKLRDAVRSTRRFCNSTCRDRAHRTAAP